MQLILNPTEELLNGFYGLQKEVKIFLEEQYSLYTQVNNKKWFKSDIPEVFEKCLNDNNIIKNWDNVSPLDIISLISFYNYLDIIIPSIKNALILGAALSLTENESTIFLSAMNKDYHALEKLSKKNK